MKPIQWTVVAICFGLGGYLLVLSYRAYGKWSEMVALGDPSGAEFYEIEFWSESGAALLLMILGAFVAGRLSVPRRPPED